MYEDLESIASLKIGKDIESISNETNEKVREMQGVYAARNPGVLSGAHEAAIGRTQIEGSERLLHAISEVWIGLIKRRNGHISSPDVDFVAKKLEGFAQTQKVNLHRVFSQQRLGAVINLLTEEASRRLQAAVANARRDLQIMAEESEAFPKPVNHDRQEQRALKVARMERHTRHTAEVLNIVIASPSDVGDERDAVEKAVHDWNAAHFESLGIMLNPIRWERNTYPASGDRPQAIINRQIIECGDILVGIFGYKLGTPTGVAQSGTIEEIEEFRKAGKYVALYFSIRDIPRNADRAQLEALESFKEQRRRDTLYFEFEHASDLSVHLTRHLPRIVHEVHERLRQSGYFAEVSADGSPEAQRAPEQAGPAEVQSSLVLADLISELEDNLNCAKWPTIGDVFRKPSRRVWLEKRNRITLPRDIQQDVTTTYGQIGRWCDVVESGLKPNLGSMDLNITISDLKTSLPSLIDRLRKLPASGS